MVEAFAGPMWGQVSGGGPSCDFNASLGSGVVTRMGKEKAIRGQAFDLTTVKGELFDGTPIGLYAMRAGKAQFFDKAEGIMRDELTLVSDDFNGESIGVWTDAGEHGTGTKVEYTRLVTWAHELAAAEGEATLTFMSPGEKRADGKPEHRVFVWKKENNGEVKGAMYSLSGTAPTIDSFAQSLGFSKISGSLENQRILQKGTTGFNHSDIFQALTVALSPEEKLEQSGYLERFRKEAQEVPDDIRWAKLRHRQEVFEKELTEFEGDIQEALGLVVQGFAALPEVLERERSQYQHTSAPVDVVIQMQKEVIPPFSSQKGLPEPSLVKKVHEHERYEKNRETLIKRTENETIPDQNVGKQSDEKVIIRNEKIVSGLALSAFALLEDESIDEHTHSSAVEILQIQVLSGAFLREDEVFEREFLPEEIVEIFIDFLDQFAGVEEVFPLTQGEDRFYDIIHFLFSHQPLVFAQTQAVPVDIFQENVTFPPDGLRISKGQKEEVYDVPIEIKKEMVEASEELVQVLYKNAIDTFPKEEIIAGAGLNQEDRGETLQRLLRVATEEGHSQEIRDVSLLLVYKEIQDIFLKKGESIPTRLQYKMKKLFLQQKLLEYLVQEVDRKLMAFIGETRAIMQDVVPLAPQEIFLGIIEGSEMIEDAPIPLDAEEKKLQIKKFIILSKLLRIINERGNSEKPFYLNKKLYDKSPLYLDVSIITLLNVLGIPKETVYRLLLSLGIEVEQLRVQLIQLKKGYDFIPSERVTSSSEEAWWLHLQYALHRSNKKIHASQKSSSRYSPFPSFMILFDYSRDVYQYL